MWLLAFGIIALFSLGVAMGENMRIKAAGPLVSWGEKEVGGWVLSLGPAFAGYAEAFEKNGVNGLALRTITEPLLDDLGISSRLHRHRILAEINRLP